MDGYGRMDTSMNVRFVQGPSTNAFNSNYQQAIRIKYIVMLQMLIGNSVQTTWSSARFMGKSYTAMQINTYTDIKSIPSK
jgi:hypothetical protein